MKKVNKKDVKGTSPEGTKGVDFKQLIAKDLKAPNFYMRLFEISPGGHTPKHSHEWEHEVYVISGSGKITLHDRDVALTEGDAVLIEPDELHQFVNTGDASLQMICVIPRQ